MSRSKSVEINKPKLYFEDLQISINQFSYELYDHVQSSTDNETNIITSPLAVHLALSLMLMGANGETAQRIAVALQLEDVEREHIATAYEQLLSSLQRYLEIANIIYVSTELEVNDSFHQMAIEQFQSEVHGIDFTSPERAAHRISEGIVANTNKRMRDMVTSELLESSTKLLLVNAIYFKKVWAKKFLAKNTHRERFYVSETDTMEVDMMHQTELYAYANVPILDAKVLILNYADANISMVIILPNKRIGLPCLEAKLKTTNLESIIELTECNEVVVSLPRFVAEFDISFSETFSPMGLATVFSPEANFNRMVDGQSKVAVSSIIHKVFVQVTEDGLDAAATDSILSWAGSNEGIPREVKHFQANHPFRYFILNDNNVIMFSGCFRCGEKLRMSRMDSQPLLA